jgi:hypothetical protein
MRFGAMSLAVVAVLSPVALAAADERAGASVEVADIAEGVALAEDERSTVEIAEDEQSTVEIADDEQSTVEIADDEQSTVEIAEEERSRPVDEPSSTDVAADDPLRSIVEEDPAIPAAPARAPPKGERDVERGPSRPDPLQATLGSCIHTAPTLLPILLQSAICPRLTGLLEPQRMPLDLLPPSRDSGPERVGPFEVRVAGVFVEAESRHLPSMPASLRVGMVPGPTLSAINASWRRAAGPTGAETAGLLTGIGFGSSVAVGIPARLGEITFAVFHPNGFLLTETQQATHLRAMRVSVSPFEPLLPATARSPLRVFAAREEASLVAETTRGLRDAIGATIENPWATFGAERTTARGLAQAVDREAQAWGGFLAVRPHARIDGFVRYDVVDQVVPVRTRFVTAGFGVRGPRIPRVAHGVDLHASWQRVQGALASAAPPDAFTTQSAVRVHVNVRF